MKHKKLLGIILTHAALLWLSLVIAYNGYKEITRFYLGPFPQNIKADIKQSFVWIILGFALLLFLYLLKRREAVFPRFLPYISIFATHTILINILFCQRGIPQIAIMNIAEVVFALLLLILYRYKAYVDSLCSKSISPLPAWVEKFLPPILSQKLPDIKNYLRDKPSAPYIIAFMLMLLICALLLILKAEKTAETLADIAYFCLVIGVGIECFQAIKAGKAEKSSASSSPIQPK